MAARRRATPWGDAEVRNLVTEVDARDYGCHNHQEHPVLHKQAVLRRISRGLAQRFGVQRSSTQIRKKLADLQYRSSERLASIRSQSLPHRATRLVHNRLRTVLLVHTRHCTVLHTKKATADPEPPAGVNDRLVTNRVTIQHHSVTWVKPCPPAVMPEDPGGP
ncbi:unnamed protein product [Ranitomeya imitator]|uniref:Transposase n=1 Tax=Ranitomeya imitator TaxID=111125 RepID=A0ABN9KU69_9NEOB|nr:unnamed protein product [Ranitomeya imitator]